MTAAFRMTTVEQLELLSAVKAGDVFELGAIMHPAGDKPEDIVWSVVEAADVKGGRKVTMHLSYMNVPLGNMQATVSDKGVTWKGVLVQ